MCGTPKPEGGGGAETLPEAGLETGLETETGMEVETELQPQPQPQPQAQPQATQPQPQPQPHEGEEEEAAADVGGDIWQCGVCTLLNPPQARACNACGVNRPREAAAEESREAAEDEPPPCCETCGGKAVAKCTRCNAAFYCGRECQIEHWKVHKKVCRPVGVDAEAKTGAKKGGGAGTQELAAGGGDTGRGEGGGVEGGGGEEEKGGVAADAREDAGEDAGEDDLAEALALSLAPQAAPSPDVNVAQQQAEQPRVDHAHTSS
jgi:hypothetical protein